MRAACRAMGANCPPGFMVFIKKLLIFALLASTGGCAPLHQQGPRPEAGVSGLVVLGNTGLPTGSEAEPSPPTKILLSGRFAVKVEGLDRGMSGRFEWVSGPSDRAADTLFLQDSWGRSQAILRRSPRPALENTVGHSKTTAPLGEWVLHNARNQPMGHAEVNDWLGQHLGVDIAGLEPLGRMLSEGLGRLQQAPLESPSVVLNTQLQGQRQLTLRIIADRDPAPPNTTPSPQ